MAGERQELNLEKFRNGKRRRRRLIIPPFPEPLPTVYSWPKAEEFRENEQKTGRLRFDMVNRKNKYYFRPDKTFRYNS